MRRRSAEACRRVSRRLGGRRRYGCGMTSRRFGFALAAASVLVMTGMLAACAGGTTTGPTPTPEPNVSESAIASPTATASPTPTADVAIPSDCRSVVSDAVVAQLSDVPLNDPALGASGVQADGSLVCRWGDPGTPDTVLTTTISRVARGPALDMLNALAEGEGFTCYTPDEGTRCEKTGQDDANSVTDGRTLYWRQNVLIDSRYANLAPTGYTSSIVATLFG